MTTGLRGDGIKKRNNTRAWRRPCFSWGGSLADQDEPEAAKHMGTSQGMLPKSAGNCSETLSCISQPLFFIPATQWEFFLESQPKCPHEVAFLDHSEAAAFTRHSLWQQLTLYLLSHHEFGWLNEYPMQLVFNRWSICVWQRWDQDQCTFDIPFYVLVSLSPSFVLISLIKFLLTVLSLQRTFCLIDFL